MAFPWLLHKIHAQNMINVRKYSTYLIVLKYELFTWKTEQNFRTKIKINSYQLSFERKLGLIIYINIKYFEIRQQVKFSYKITLLVKKYFSRYNRNRNKIFQILILTIYKQI